MASVPHSSHFVGRDAELHQLATLLPETPLITLTGPGGIGKTQLAAEAARAVRARGWPVHWVALDPLTSTDRARDTDTSSSGDRVRLLIAQAITPDDTTTTDSAAHPPTLLVLDTCEQVLPAVRTVADELLADAPTLHILATSREPLGWTEEHIMTVPPLASEDAVTLLRRRAELTGRPIPDDPQQLAIAERICRHVDNNPLFIRLAAARLLHQPPALVLQELSAGRDDRRMRWTHGARVSSEPRHHSVSAVLDWSYRLCSPAEQLLLQRLSVFAPGHPGPAPTGAELSAITAVCADPLDAAAVTLPPESIEALVERLVERSLVVACFTPERVRYYLPESVRIYAAALPNSQRRTLIRRHRAYYLDAIAAGRIDWYGPHEQRWLQWARPAWDNICTAIDSGLDEPSQALTCLEVTITLMSMPIPFVTAAANHALAQLAERAVETVAALNDPPTQPLVAATALIAGIGLWHGSTPITTHLLDACVRRYYPEVPTRWHSQPENECGLPAHLELTWGLELLLNQRDPRAIDVLSRARDKFAAAGSLTGTTRSEAFLAVAAAFLGERHQALDLTDEHLHTAATSGSAWATTWAHLARSVALTKHGRTREAVLVAQDALRHLPPADTWTASWAIGAYFSALAQILADRIADTDNAEHVCATEGPDRVTGGEGADRDASRGGTDDDEGDLTAAAREIAYLVGGFQSQHRWMGTAIDRVPLVAAEIRHASDTALAVLGGPAYAAAAAHGAHLRPEADELQHYVLGTLPADRLPSPAPHPSRWNTLTETERAVAILVAAGWTNSAIASHRGSSVRTVDTHVTTIRHKLQVNSRADVLHSVPAPLADQVHTHAQHKPPRTHRRTP